MEVHFSKYHGAGNDFVVIDNRDICYNLCEDMRKKMCDRRFGIGGDGLIEIRSSDMADFKMVYYNSDGREGSLCGNGARCALAFALRLGIQCSATSSKENVEEGSYVQDNILKMPERTQGKSGVGQSGSQGTDDTRLSYRFEASDGIHFGGLAGLWSSECAGRESSKTFCVKMSDVKLEQVKVYDNGDVFLDTGSPHHVTFVTSGVEGLNVVQKGRELRKGLYGDAGSNINFVEERTISVSMLSNVVSPQNEGNFDDDVRHGSLEQDFSNGSAAENDNPQTKMALKTNDRVNKNENHKDESIASPNDSTGCVNEIILITRTYERGVEDETWACGTGAVAVAIADYVRKNFVKETTKETDRMLDVLKEDQTHLTSEGVGSPKCKHGGSNERTDAFICRDENKTEIGKRTIKMPGGCLHVAFKVNTENASPQKTGIVFSDVILSGPAEHVFDGIYPI